MAIRFSGAVLILAGCTGIGFSAASLCRTKVRVIQHFLYLIDCMVIELNCRVTPLPELCRVVSDIAGPFKNAIVMFSHALDTQIAPDPVACMEYTVGNIRISCPEFLLCLRELSGALGCYDLVGQVRQLEVLRSKWSKILDGLEQNLTLKIRNFRIFGICAGCALAILLV